MFRIFLVKIAFWVLLFGGSSIKLTAQDTSHEFYGYSISDSLLNAKTVEQIDRKERHSISKDKQTQQLTKRKVSKIKKYNNRVLDFSIILSLVTILAILHYRYPHYFKNLFKAFRNTTLSTRQLRSQLQNDAAANILMNVFFCFSLATFIFFTLRYINNGSFSSKYSPLLILGAALLLLIVTYSVRFGAMKLAGWVFRIDTATESYTFNIFLVNKILAIFILPFTAIIAFGQGQWVQISLLLALILVVLLTLNRFARSGSSMRAFFIYSKFHFFLYLCASEILPLAILVKIVFILMIK